MRENNDASYQEYLDFIRRSNAIFQNSNVTEDDLVNEFGVGEIGIHRYTPSAVIEILSLDNSTHNIVNIVEERPFSDKLAFRAHRVMDDGDPSSSTVLISLLGILEIYNIIRDY